MIEVVKITEASMKNGYASDKEDVKTHLTIGEYYAVKKVIQYDYRTTIELVDFPGMLFNSVLLVEVKQLPPDKYFGLLEEHFNRWAETQDHIEGDAIKERILNFIRRIEMLPF